MFPISNPTTLRPVTLTFSIDRHSTLPRLRFDGDDSITSSELSRWQEELSNNFEQLSSAHASRVFEFSSAVRNLPRCYRVKVKQTRSKGVPTLILTSLASEESAGANLDQKFSVPVECAPTETDSREAVGTASTSTEVVNDETLEANNASSPDKVAPLLVNTLYRLFANLPLGRAQQLAIDEVLCDLNQLASQEPRTLLLFMLGGYLQICRQSRTIDSQREIALHNASYTVDELCAVLLEGRDEQTSVGSRHGELVQRNFRKLYEVISGGWNRFQESQ